MMYIILAFLIGIIVGVGGLFILALNYNSHEADRDRTEKDIRSGHNTTEQNAEISTEIEKKIKNFKFSG